MAVWGISDLHLGFRADKPMTIFGSHWAEHPDCMAVTWDEIVADDDVVLVPGDNSWAMRLEEADLDLAWIADRPGTKILLKGNHDYWWSSIGRVRAALPESLRAVQNDVISVDKYHFAGSRLWDQPGHRGFNANDRKIFLREIERLKLSLQLGKKAAARDGRELIVLCHYPPFAEDGGPSPFTELIEDSGARLCVYGHLHGRRARGQARAREGEIAGVEYRLLSCDLLNFSPLKLRE
tara:strand:- start:369 stop:1079 length:711 start_codon:yes stop_codon:yes gene_type:complete